MIVCCFRSDGWIIFSNYAEAVSQAEETNKIIMIFFITAFSSEERESFKA